MDLKDPAKSEDICHHEEDVVGKLAEPASQISHRYDAEDEKQYKQLLRKLDMRIIPILAVLYLLSFLDRGPNHILGRASPLC